MTGAMTRRSSSTRSAATIDRARVMLPCTPMLDPSVCFRPATNVARSSVTTVRGPQSAAGSREPTTYFCTLLMNVANGSTSDVGQYAAHSSYIPRPSSTASCSAITSARLASSRSSQSRMKSSGD